jgi:YVTN family beta-propeller protein
MSPIARAARACLLTAAILVSAPATGLAAKKTKTAVSPTRPVLTVGNNWDGTADLIDPVKFTRLARLNIVPDKDQRMAELMLNPVDFGYFLAIRQLIGEGHDQFVDDAFTSNDGRFLYVSRPSFKDVVAISFETKKIIWRTEVEGQRADHMAISPDGKRLVVSASTAKKAHVLDTATGKILGSFESGDSPHENNFSRDGSKIFHASIGLVYTPLDEPQLDSTKGDRWFEVVDAKTLKVLKRIDMGQKLKEAGFPGMSSAVRPMALTPDERYVYFQVSFFHGFVEYDLKADKVLSVLPLPLSEKAQSMRREDYLLDSAHHGLTMNPSGTKLCVAGTMSDYAAIVNRRTYRYMIAAHGTTPYWSTNSGDGNYCFVSFSGDDNVGVISYRTNKLVTKIPVGDHPQRMRMGVIRKEFLR